MKIAFVTPELKSLIRRTNLAEIAESLPRALKGAGSDARVFVPWCKGANTAGLGNLEKRATVEVLDDRARRTFNIYGGMLDGLEIYLFDQHQLFAPYFPYGDTEGPYPENWRRYAAFSRAFLESLPVLDFRPDVIHCFDWTTGLIPVLREIEYAAIPGHPAAGAGTYFAIHNLAMQGSYEREILPRLGLPHRIFQHVGGLELNGKANFLKAGAEFATIIGTHSPGHAERIQELDRGYGLEETFKRRSKELVGICNGIDYQTWDPRTDPLLPQTYSSDDRSLAGKRQCKAALQSTLKLDNGPRTPVAVMIGRFDSDSGFDLLAEMLTPILERGVEVVMMGAGRPDIQERLKTMEGTFTGRCRVVDGYNVPVAHLLMGGGDLLLLPSHYNPGNSLCAIGMRYGVVPIIYEHNGLEDFVIDATAHPGTGTGVHFATYSGDGLVEGIDAARKIYRDANAWKSLVLRCLKMDLSWQATAASYLKAYRRVTRRIRGRGKG